MKYEALSDFEEHLSLNEYGRVVRYPLDLSRPDPGQALNCS